MADDESREGSASSGSAVPREREAPSGSQESESKESGSNEPGSHEDVRQRALRSVCVYCGSSDGASPAFRAAAESVGRLLATRGLRLIYGGGQVGLMGTLASAAASAGGEVVGVIPRALLGREIGPEIGREAGARGVAGILGVADLRVVDSMHERKALMAELADGFIALPGGYGTIEEICEIATWAQLGIHRKPCGLLDVEGYFAPLLAQFDLAVEAGFVRPEQRRLILTERDPERLLDLMAAQVTPPHSSL